jgi:hypothetical protein
MVAVADDGFRLEEYLERAKQEVRLDEYEVRP